MAASGFISDTVEIAFSCFVMDLSRVFRLKHSQKTKNKRGSVCLSRRDREWSKSSIDEKTSVGKDNWTSLILSFLAFTKRGHENARKLKRTLLHYSVASSN